MIRVLLRGAFLVTAIITFTLILGHEPLLLAVALLIAVGGMLWKSWVLATRAEPRR